MPRNGSGAYIAPSGQPVVSGTIISDTVFNALVADLGAELTKSICTDGQTPMTAALPMGNNKITGLTAGTAPSDAARFDQIAAAAFLPLSGGIMTGSPMLSNNVSIQMKDSGGTSRTFAVMAPDNGVSLTVAGGNYFRILNQAYAAVLWNIDNSGNTSQIGNHTFNNNSGIFSKDAGGTARQQLVVAGDNNTYFTNVGGQSIIFNNQAGSSIASLSNAGTFTAVVVTQTSDERKKTNWRQLTDAQLDALANMEKSGLFDWLDGSGESCGGSAQEIRAIIPQAVFEDEHGSLTVNYGGLAFAIAQASLRRQKRERAAFEQRLAALEALPHP